MINQTQTPQDMDLNTLISNIKLHLGEMNYRPCSITRYDVIWQKLIVYCEHRGVVQLTAELGREFVWKQYGAALGDKDTSHNVNRAIHILLDFQKFGTVFKQSCINAKGFSAEYKTLLEGFIEHLRRSGFSEVSIRTWKSRLFRFEYYLQHNGIMSFFYIEKEDVYSYLESLTYFSTGTICSARTLFRRLFDYAIQNGFHTHNFINTLPDVRRINKYRLPTVFTADEVVKILDSVDRSNALGKRNYAILALVAKLGLRIGDVRSLQFDNIDWQNKTISLIQNKTGVALSLPLLEDIGWAIIDYLQNGRPQTSCKLIFVRHCAPYDGFTDALRQTILKCLNRAGIKVTPQKHIGMHSFRHSLASTMLKNGEKYNDIAQTLGHTSMESVESYLHLDEVQLRKCALEVDF